MDGVKSELLVSDNHTAGKGKLCGMLGIEVQVVGQKLNRNLD